MERNASNRRIVRRQWRRSIRASMAVLCLAAALPAFAPTGAVASRAAPGVGPAERGGLVEIPDGRQPRSQATPAPTDVNLPANGARGYAAEKAAAEHDRRASVPAPTLDVARDVQRVVTTSFEGLNSQTGGGFSPPDTIVAKSPTRVVEAVNSAIRMTTTSGTLVQSMSLDTFLSSSASTQGSPFDPKIFYDRNSVRPRMYVVALQKVGDDDLITSNDSARLILAVSRSSDPTTLSSSGWCRYAFNAEREANTSSATWADYPGLGIGADSVVISENQFTFTAPNTFRYPVLRVLRKSVINDNAASCPSATSIPTYTFLPPGLPGSYSFFTMQPVQHYTSPSSFIGASSPVYLVNSLGSGQSSYRVWRLANLWTSSPSLTSTTVPTFITYSTPVNAPGGATAGLDSGDTRVLQAAGIGNSITFVNGSGCNFTSFTPPEACLRIVKIQVGQSPFLAPTASLTQVQSFGGGNGYYDMYPSVAVNSAGAAAVAFQRTTGLTVPTTYLSTRFITKTSSASFVSSSALGPSGTCALTVGLQSGRYRAGDYTGAQTDTDGVGFWLAGERATLSGSNCIWSTRVGRVTV